MQKNYVIIGLGRFGLSLIDELSKYSDNVVGIDINTDAVETASRMIEHAYIADSTSEKAMKSLGVQNADHIVIAFGDNFEGTILTFVTLKDLGCNNITVRCDRDSYIPILKKIGVTDIISPTKLAGVKLALRIVSPDFVDYFSLTNDYCVVEVPVPATFKTKKLMEIDARNRFDVNLLLIRREKQTITPKANEEIRPQDVIFVFGTNKRIVELTEYLKEN